MHDPKRPKYKRQFSMDNGERRSHTRDVYPSQDTPCMGTARVKQEEETDLRNLEEMNVVTKGKVQNKT